MMEYRIDLPSGQTTVLLSDADAAARGLTAEDVPTKAHTPANKARRPSTKRAEAAKSAFRKDDD